MSDQHKPTTGSSLEASHQTFNELVHDNQQLREQLVAEREAVQQYKTAFENANDTCKQLRSQLASAVEVMREIDKAGAYYREHRIKLIAALVKIGGK